MAPAASAVAWAVAGQGSVPAALRTLAESSGYTRTGRYDEVIRLCRTFEKTYPASVRCRQFGQTPEGRPLLALIASQDGTFDPESARARHRPVVLAQAGIHAGEIEGKDAGFFLLRQLLSGPAQPSNVLSRLTFVFVPVFNVDGHERFGPYQRPNQNGPVEGGWRTTAQNLNLNRDYVKSEAPEMAAMLGLLHAWDPILYIDLHTTDGAEFQPDVALTIEPRLSGTESLRPIGAALSQRVMESLRKTGHLPLDFYPSFVRTDDPSSGFANEMAPPRFSTGYFPLWNRFAALIETHSWKPYAHRVRTTIDALSSLLVAAADDGPRWLLAAEQADQADLHLSGTTLPLEYEHGPRTTRLRFPGYAYAQEPSAVSGTLRTRYDAHHPEIWDIPFYPDVVPQHIATVPSAYLVPPAYAELVLAKLHRHGLHAEQLASELVLPAGEAEVYRITSHHVRAEPYEGRHPVEVQGSWQPLSITPAAPAPGSLDSRTLPAGTLIVPTAQRGGKLVVHLLEPTAPDSLLAWGYLSGIFEQKEYMEEYVAESVAEKMLSGDAALRSEFSRKLHDDPVFARDPQARLAFFYHRHPSHDARKDVYPIRRILHPLPAPQIAGAM